MNTKKQGDAGLGKAIAYFASLGHTVSVPLTDSQEYDLIVDDGIINRVQVKSTSFKKNGNFQISLTVKGGNRTSAGKIKKLDTSKVDIVFVSTSDGTLYKIPTNELENKANISLYNKYDKFKCSVA